MKYILLLLSIMVCPCETQQVVEESIACDYGKQFICPNCGEPFDGHECENCKYTEERWKDSSLYLKECYYG